MKQLLANKFALPRFETYGGIKIPFEAFLNFCATVYATPKMNYNLQQSSI